MIFTILLAIFIFVPILELAILIELGKHLGLLGTLGLIVLTGAVGAALAKMEGLRLIMDIQNEMRFGRIPAPKLVDGVIILIAGVMLITPGLLTDVAGFLLLIPSFRDIIRKAAREVIRKRIDKGVIEVDYKEW